MSYTTHASHMRELFGKLGVDTTKLTHELRIFAAQLLYEMGVGLEVRESYHMLSRLEAVHACFNPPLCLWSLLCSICH